MNENHRVRGIKIDIDTLRIFRETISTLDLENELRLHGYNDSIYASQGWNIIDNDIERIVIEFLKNKEWEIY